MSNESNPGLLNRLSNGSTLSLTPYDEECLEKSWEWLNDPEIRFLTMTPEFSKADQRRFFNSLATRADYLIWAVSLDGKPIGAAGLKNHRESMAEYWGYIGEKALWGGGLGRSMLALVEQKGRSAGFSSLDLKVLAKNERALSLYRKCGYVVDAENSSADVLRMIKREI